MPKTKAAPKSKTKATPKSKLVELKTSIVALREQAKKECYALFQDAAKEIFRAHPDLKSFSWTQYTPYFNDGDECVFSARTDYIDIVMKDGTEEEYYETSYSKKEAVTPLQKAGRDAITFLTNFDNEDYKDMFGDHVRVTVTAEGVDSDNYEHD
jgi:hypothetical protein